MESKIKSSFIPKKPIAKTPAHHRTSYRTSGVDAMMLVSIISLAIAVALSGFVFFYSKVIDTELTKKHDQLQSMVANIKPSSIKKLMQLSERIRIAEGILANHIAPSVFFTALERDTLKSIQFTKFKYKQKNADIGNFTMDGVTHSVNSIALQSRILGNSSIISEPIFSDIDLVKTGVKFTVDGDIDLKAIRFSSLFDPISEPTDTMTDTLDQQIDTRTAPSNYGQFGNTQ